MKREMVCIACPIGCRLVAEWDDGIDEQVRITGNRCKKGEEYGREELLSPSRVVTATVALSGGGHARAPVRSSAALAKRLIPGLLDELYRITIDPPLLRGACVIRNFRDSGVDVVATRTIARSEDA